MPLSPANIVLNQFSNDAIIWARAPLHVQFPSFGHGVRHNRSACSVSSQTLVVTMTPIFYNSRTGYMLLEAVLLSVLLGTLGPWIFLETDYMYIGLSLSFLALLMGILNVVMFFAQYVKHAYYKQWPSPVILLLVIPCLASGLSAGWCAIGAGLSGIASYDCLFFGILGFSNLILLVVIVLTFALGLIAKLKS